MTAPKTPIPSLDDVRAANDRLNLERAARDFGGYWIEALARHDAHERERRATSAHHTP